MADFIVVRRGLSYFFEKRIVMLRTVLGRLYYLRVHGLICRWPHIIWCHVIWATSFRGRKPREPSVSRGHHLNPLYLGKRVAREPSVFRERTPRERACNVSRLYLGRGTATSLYADVIWSP